MASLDRSRSPGRHHHDSHRAHKDDREDRVERNDRHRDAGNGSHRSSRADVQRSRSKSQDRDNRSRKRSRSRSPKDHPKRDADGHRRGRSRTAQREGDKHRRSPELERHHDAGRDREGGRERDAGHRQSRWRSPERDRGSEAQRRDRSRDGRLGREGLDGRARQPEYDRENGVERDGGSRRQRSASPARARRGWEERGPAWNPAPAAAPPGPPPVSSAPPDVGSIHRGTVHTIRPFGIFVAIQGHRRHVMVHHTQVSEEIQFSREDDDESKVKGLEFYFPKGTQVFVKILEVAPDARGGAELRVNGSMRVVDQATGEDLDPTGRIAMAAAASGPGGGRGGGHGGGGGGGGPLSEEPPEVGNVYRAKVVRIEAYGVFVSLDGYRKHGLVHSSQVSNYLSFSREDTDEQKKAELAGVVSVGEPMYVKVVEVAEDPQRGGFKIGCSIKLVNQTTGEDTDPTGLRYKPRDSGQPGGGGGGLGAHVGEIGRGGKIDWGHLAADNKLYVNDKEAARYKLLEEEPQPRQQAGAPLGSSVQHLGGAGGPPGPPGPGAAALMGRGRGMVLPAWMTQQPGQGGPAAPGSLPGPPPLPPGGLPPRGGGGSAAADVDPGALLLDLVGGGGGGASITSIEQALAILERHQGLAGGKGSKKKSKKDKKDKKEKKDKGKKDKSKKSKSSSGKKEKSGRKERSGSGRERERDRRSGSSSSSSGSDSD